MARLVCAVLLVVCLAPGHVSKAQELGGTWEGELLDPVRPMVMTLNLDEKAFSFSGGADTPIAKLRDEAGAIAFEVTGRQSRPRPNRWPISFAAWQPRSPSGSRRR